jgi:hypothetical protein
LAAVADSVPSCGSINMRRIDHLPPLPCVVEPAAASRVSPGSSPSRSDASEGAAAVYAADPDPEPEASTGRSTQTQLAMAAMGARGGPYGRRPASSYGRSVSLFSALLRVVPGRFLPEREVVPGFLVLDIACLRS